MKRLIFSIVFILSAFVLSSPAQNSSVRQTFGDGIKFANKGEFETALAHFQSSLKLTENDPANKIFLAKIHFNIGVCFYRLKLQPSAVIEFEKAISLDPNYEKAFYALGMAQFELENWRESEKAFLGAINLNAENGETWFDLAFVYLVDEDYDSAKNAFQKSIFYKSVSSGIGHNNLGVIFALNGNFLQAIEEFKASLIETKGKLTAAENNLKFAEHMNEITK